MYSLDKIAQKKWKIVERMYGFDIIDDEGDTAMVIKGSKHG
jgi:hypothetical protein